MIVYWLVWITICFFNFLSIKKIHGKILFLIFSVFLVFFIGLRYEVGADWWNYLVIYEKYKYLDFKYAFFNRDAAYSILNIFSNYLNIEDTILVNFTCAILVVIFVYKLAICLEKYWLVFLIYFPYHFLVVSMGYTRQSVAIAISSLAFYYLLNKNYKFFLFLIFFAFLFHQTAIVLLLFFPIVFFSNLKNKIYYYLYILFSVFAILLMILLTNNDSNIYLSSTDEISSQGFLVRWSYHLIPILIYLRIRNEIVGKLNRYFLNYMFLIALLLLPLGVAFSTFADRFNLYLIFFDIYLIVYFIKHTRRVNQIILLGIMVLFYSLQIFIWMFYGEWAVKAWIPYENYISNYLMESVF